jgi:hypothetical protein
VKLAAARVADLAVIAFFALFVFEARGWRLEARLYPWAVGLPMLALAVAHLVSGLRRGVGGLEPRPADPGAAGAEARRRALALLGWGVGLLAGVWILGFPAGTALFVLLYLKLQAGEGWGLALGLTGLAGLLCWGLFDRVLRVPFPEGLVTGWLGLG